MYQPAVAAVAGCSDVAATTCVSAGALSGTEALVYYQVLGACANGTEGPV